MSRPATHSAATLALDDVNRVNLDWTQGALAEGLRLYRAGEFFAAHEEWESVWLVTPEPEKTFLQGVIQVTAAFHHLQRNNPLGATRLLNAALRRLEPCSPHFGGIAVDLLRDDIRDCLHALTTAPPAANRLRPPRIHPL